MPDTFGMVEQIRDFSGDYKMKVPGFKAAAIAAELRYTGRPDLGLIIASEPVAAAGVFTEKHCLRRPGAVVQG